MLDPAPASGCSCRTVTRPATAGAEETAGSSLFQPAWASLLADFYARAGLRLPPLLRLRGPAMPSPYRQLLVHSNDMTSTLEDFYREAIRLQVLARVQHDGLYEREVVLRLARTRRPVEYGAIRIHLARFPETARRVILSEGQPFGTILESEGVAYVCWPQAFFRVTADNRMGHLLEHRAGIALFGRRNVVLDQARRLLAEVIEILAPVPDSFSHSKTT